MKRECPSCKSSHNFISKHGTFIRNSDGRSLRRYKCRLCKKTFSEATFQQCYRQRKRRLNLRVLELLCANVSQRRTAKLLRIHRTTVALKLEFLYTVSVIKNKRYFKDKKLCDVVQFDELESFEHTKCKPLSVLTAINPKTREILGFKVCTMPAKGRLAEISRKKYGLRKDERKQGREELFLRLKSMVNPQALFVSDKSPFYPKTVKKFFPEATHKTYKGRNSKNYGQGELKKGGFDPLFGINHNFAMFRANISRLIRQTWCTTKDKDKFIKHLESFMYYYNTVIITEFKTT